MVQATNSKEDIKKLLSVGFEYVCQKDDVLILQKAKIGRASLKPRRG